MLQGILILFITIIYFGINAIGIIKIIDLCENKEPYIPSTIYWAKLIGISIGCILSAIPCLFLIGSII